MKLTEILKRKVLPLFFASTLTFSSFVGCEDPTPDPTPTPDPIVNQLPETTKPLDDSTTDRLISYENGILTFNETTEQLGSILTGDIIVAGVNDVIPNGILRKVTSISNNDKTIYTIQTNLEEAIKNCSVEFNNKLTPSLVESSILARGVMDRSLGEGFDFNINLENVILYDADENPSTVNDQVIANGNISFNSDFDIYLQIQDFKLTELKFENKINEIVNLELIGECSMPYINKTIKIAEYNFTPFVAVWIPTTPPFPIVLAPKLEVNVNFEGELSSDITISVTQNVELISGLLYENGNWSPISDFSNDFQFNEPQLTANAFAKVSVGPRLNLLLYGVAGPYAEINGYSKIEADVNEHPWWSLYGGLEAKLGVNVQVLGRTIADYNKTVIDFEKLLAEGENTTSILTDSRDGKIYNIIKIGNQWWMAENLNYEIDNSWYYGNDPHNGDIYGRLYNWEAACNSCPDEWHLPSLDEWSDLVNYLGGKDISGGKVKEAGTLHWNFPNTGATNESGFTALPGGMGHEILFRSLGEIAHFWSNKYDNTYSYYVQLNYNSASLYVPMGYTIKEHGFSVRCVKD